MLAGLAALLLTLAGGGHAGASVITSETVLYAAPSVDTSIHEADPGNPQDGATLDITGETAAGSRQRAAVRFDLSAIPGDASITSATLTLSVATNPGSDTDITPIRLAAASTWDASATWTSDNAAWNVGTAGTPVTVGVASSDAIFDVTADVQALIGAATNNGWAFRGSGAGSLQFDSATGAIPPALALTYATNTSTLSPTGTHTSDTPGSFEDTYISTSNSSSVNGALDNLEIILNATDRSDALIKFDLAAEAPPLAGASIVNATLTLPVVTGAGGGRNFAAARVCTPPELKLDGAITGATYDNIPGNQLTRHQLVNYAYTPGDPALVFDVTPIVQDWANGEAQIGFQVFQSGAFALDAVFLGSFNHAAPAMRPELVIEYVEDTGAPNTAPPPTCDGVIPTPSATSTPDTPTPTNTNTPTPTLTPTPTATLVQTPAMTTELDLSNLATGVSHPRSRLTFELTDGALAPDSVVLVIERESDGTFWNGDTGEWQPDEFENPAADAGGDSWSLGIAGADRREFANTALVVTLRAAEGTDEYYTAPIADVHIR